MKLVKLFLIGISILSLYGCTPSPSQKVVTDNDILNKAETAIKNKNYRQAIEYNHKFKEVKNDVEMFVLVNYAGALQFKPVNGQGSEKYYNEYMNKVSTWIYRVCDNKYEGRLSEEINREVKTWREKNGQTNEVMNDEDKRAKLNTKISLDIKGTMKSRVAYVETFDNAAEGLGITIRADAVSSGATESSIEYKNLTDCVDIFDTLYNSGKYNINYVTVLLYGKGINQSGNEVKILVMKCTLRKTTASMIDWKRKNQIKWEDTLDEFRAHRNN